jgi:hypothetical protein
MDYKEKLARREYNRIARENSVYWAQLLECGCAFDVYSWGKTSSTRPARFCVEHSFLMDSDWNGSEINDIDRIEPGGPKWHWGEGTVMPAIYMRGSDGQDKANI